MLLGWMRVRHATERGGCGGWTGVLYLQNDLIA